MRAKIRTHQYDHDVNILFSSMKTIKWDVTFLYQTSSSLGSVGVIKLILLNYSNFSIAKIVVKKIERVK